MKTHTSQCDSCAFKFIESQAAIEDDIFIEAKYNVLRKLSNAPPKPRKISVSLGVERTEDTDKTETCFIGSPLWPTKIKDIYCPDRVENCLSLETALSLRAASKASRVALEAARWAQRAGIIAIIAAIIAAKEQINSTILLLLP